MKILFLYINAYKNLGIPLGLTYIIPILKKQGHTVFLFETTFYNFDYSSFNIKENIDEFGHKIITDFQKKVTKIKPDIIGVSSVSLGLKFATKMIESLGKNRPKTIFGGVGPTLDWENLIKKISVDYVCVGFGEDLMPKLLKAIKNKKDLSNIPNLIYKNRGYVIKNNFHQNIALANTPIQDWSLFNPLHFKRIFKNETKKWGNFQLTRGCPFNCAYCVNAFYHKNISTKIHHFPIKKIIQEMELLSTKYNLDIVRIFDECFGFGKLDYYWHFANLYRKQINLPTIVETRAEVINKQTIKILKKINCVSVSLGIEAGNEQFRQKMLNRYISNETIKNAFRLLRQANIRTASYNIIGFPTETRENIFETIKLNRECKPDFINVFIFSPFPKTQLRKYCIEKNLLETDAIIDYSQRSIIKNKNLSKQELYGLYRTFPYYVQLPYNLFPLTKRAEIPDQTGATILALLKKVTTKNKT